MKILITGGAGYLGRALVRSLTEGRNTIRIFDLQAPPSTHSQPGCEYVCGDLLDAQGLGTALRDIEAVYHLAWSFYPDDHRREVEENLLGTLNLLNTCKGSQVRHFIFASSAVVYGPTGEEPAREIDPCHPERSTVGGPVYGITKLACEYYTLAWGREGLPITIMRIHGVFSKDRLAQFSTMIDQAIESKEIHAFTEAGGHYAHLDDVISALCGVLGKQQAFGQIYNVAGCRVYRDKEIAQYIAQMGRAGSKVSLVSDPGQGMILVSIDKLSQSVGYHPRKVDFLRDLIDSYFE